MQNSTIMLRHLRERIFCRLAPSTVQGVGVFAVRPIPDGVEPFLHLKPNACAERACANLSEATLRRQRVPPEVRDMIRQFFFQNEDAAHTYPVCDLNAIDISFYLNHSAERANVAFRTCACMPRCRYDHIVTLRPIAAGEELLLDYQNVGLPMADKHVA